jgi:hypothetical protein
MHLRTHVKAANRGKHTHGDSEYIDGMIEHDNHVGLLLKAIDDLGIAKDTIVVYSTDNGPHMNTWPGGAKREFAYGAESKIGTFSESLMSEAKKSGWGVVSMKNDWKSIFPRE